MDLAPKLVFKGEHFLVVFLEFLDNYLQHTQTKFKYNKEVKDEMINFAFTCKVLRLRIHSFILCIYLIEAL